MPLNEARRERLELLIEEASEVIKAGTKILRHGYNSYNPDNPKAGNNKEQLYRELLELFAIYEQMVLKGDIPPINFQQSVEVWKRKLLYCHYQ